MAIIEINSNDLELLQNDFSDIQTKMETLRETLDKDFVLEKQLDLFTNGLSKMDMSMENTSEDAMETVRLIGMYNEEMANIEEVFARKFDDIEVPNIEEVDSNVFDQISQGTISVEPTEEPEMEYTEGGNEEEEYTEEYGDIEEVPLYDMSEGEDTEGEIDLSDDANYEDMEEVPLYDMGDGEAGAEEEMPDDEFEELLRSSDDEAAMDSNTTGGTANYGASINPYDSAANIAPQVSSVNDTLTDSIAESVANIDLGGGEA